MFGFLNYIDKKPRKYVFKNRIFINENNYFDLKGEGIQMGAFGMNGTGKTFNMIILYNQMQCVLFFDPQGRGQMILKKQGEEKNWTFLKMTEVDTCKNRFLIRARDIQPRVLNLMAHRTSAKDYLMRKILRIFLLKPDEERTYDNLRKMLVSQKLDSSWDELSAILDPNDLGTVITDENGEKKILNLKDFNTSGRYCIDVSDRSRQDMGIGIVTESMIGYRVRNEHFAHTHPLMLAIDECQDWIEADTFTGRAWGSITGKSRTYNVSSGISGVTQGPIETTTKNQLKLLFIHKVTYEAKIFTAKYGIALFDAEIIGIPYGEDPDLKGWCRYYNILTDNLTGVLLRPDFYYKSLRVKEDEEYRVRRENVGGYVS